MRWNRKLCVPKNRANGNRTLRTKAMYSVTHKSIVKFSPVASLLLATEAAMIRCQQCSNQNMTNAEFCDECGTRLISTTRQSFTPPPPSFLRDDIKPNPVRPISPISKLFLDEAEKLPTAARLTLNLKGFSPQEFLLTKPEILIGRWDATRGIFPDIDLEQSDTESKVSRRHARIICREGQYWIEDLGSLNGTIINRQQRLQQGKPVQLRDGDEIIVGKTFLKFSVT